MSRIQSRSGPQLPKYQMATPVCRADPVAIQQKTVSEKPCTKRGTSPKKANKESKGGIISKFADKATRWAKVSEPSGDALERYRKAEFKKSKVTGQNDPDAPLKLCIPSTKLPEDAIKPAGKGPEPEDLLRKRLEQRAKPPGSSSSGWSVPRSCTTAPSSASSWRTKASFSSERLMRKDSGVDSIDFVYHK